MARPGICIGMESFRELREIGCCYIDKTPLIERLLGEERAEVSLFTRPRRFGKTLALSMLAEFFDIRKESSGLFDGLKIAGNEQLCRDWMNRYPVLSFSLKDLVGETFSDFLDLFSDLASNIAIRFSYLLESHDVDVDLKRKLARVKSGRADRIELCRFPLNLCHALRAHHGKPVIVLVDEYDAPLAEAWRNHFHDEMASFFHLMMASLLKGNDSLQLAVLAGCLTAFSGKDVFMVPGNVVCHGLADPAFADSFGFTEQEVERLLADAGLSQKMEEIREWYDGYRFGNDQEIYCPWDVLQYVLDLRNSPNMRPQTYWRNTSSNAIVKSFLGKASLKTRQRVEVLVGGGCITVPVLESITFDELYTTEDNVWTVLYATGYLTRAPQEARRAGESALQPRKENLVIPNREVREIYEDNIIFWTGRSVAGEDRRDFLAAFWAGDAATVTT